MNGKSLIYLRYKGIKSIVYSTSEAGSAFREEFDATWESFNLGAAESLTKLDEIQERFNNLLDNSFKDEMGNRCVCVCVGVYAYMFYYF